MADNELVTRVVQRFVLAGFGQGDGMDEPPPASEQRDTNKILSKLRAGVARTLRGLDGSQASERRALQALQKAVGRYDDDQVPTLRAEQDIQFHALVATKNLDEPLDPKLLIEDAKTLGQLMAVTG